MTPRQAPRSCPVCSSTLALTRLSCDECGTELAGHFPTCEFCVLTPEDRQTLRVFLSSRGNMKEVERHLGVSYPTARARFDAILTKVGIAPGAGDEPENPQDNQDRVGVLEQLHRGEIDIDEALGRLG